MIKHIVIIVYIFYSSTSTANATITWKNECVGYYQLQLPDNLDVNLSPSTRTYIKDMFMSSIFSRQPQKPKVIKSIYSNFYYKAYRILISEKNFDNFEYYKEKISKKLLDQGDNYKIKDHSSDAFLFHIKHLTHCFSKKKQ